MDHTIQVEKPQNLSIMKCLLQVTSLSILAEIFLSCS